MVCHLAAGIKVIDFPVSSKYLYTVVLPNRDDIQRELGINRKQNQKPVKSIQCENIQKPIFMISHSNDAVEKIIFNLPFSRKSGPEFISQIDLCKWAISDRCNCDDVQSIIIIYLQMPP